MKHHNKNEANLQKIYFGLFAFNAFTNSIFYLKVNFRIIIIIMMMMKIKNQVVQFNQ